MIDTEPMPTVDPTAELLGTASRRRRPARATTLTGARAAACGAGEETGGQESRGAAEISEVESRGG